MILKIAAILFPKERDKAALPLDRNPPPRCPLMPTPLRITGKHIMIRKLLFAAAAAFVGKKLMDRNRDTKSMNGTGSQRATDMGNSSASYTGSTGGAAGGHVPTDLMTDHPPRPNERADEDRKSTRLNSSH